MHEWFLLEIIPLFNIGQMPSRLPQNLIFQCPNQETWTYVDKVCDMRNDCGNCSDESSKSENVWLIF